MNIKGFGTVTEEEIALFEKETGFAVPDDYRAFLKEYNGGELQGEDNLITVEDAEDDIMVDVLFGIGKNLKSDFNIRNCLKECEEDIPKDRVIIIGADEGGILILLANYAKRKGVYIWDYEGELEKTNSENCGLYKVADTFTEFLQKIRD